MRFARSTRGAGLPGAASGMLTPFALSSRPLQKPELRLGLPTAITPNITRWMKAVKE